MSDPLVETWRVYRLLFARSVLVAAGVYAVLAVVHAWNLGSSSWSASVIWTIAGFAAPVIVQGALVAIVRALHDAVRPPSIGALLADARARFWPLLGASLLYGLCLTLGLLALVVPGLLVASRWSLLAPLIMLERRSVGDARERSRALVLGHTGPVLFRIGIVFLAISIPSAVAQIFYLRHHAATEVVVSFVWSTLTAPFQAHLLSVLYYRLKEPDRPVVHPDVATWSSVWEAR